MKIVKLKGGLGNQMFQYAFAKNLEKITNGAVKLDFSAYSELGDDMIRVPRITRYNLSLHTASKEDLSTLCVLSHSGNSQTLRYKIGVFLEKTINKKYFWEPDRAYRDIEELSEKYDYFDGYWQSWRYYAPIKQQIYQDFIPNCDLSDKTRETADTIRNENAVFIGVRKGDYDKERKHYGSFSSRYYEKAMTYIAERINRPVFYVFSNDIEWSKKNIVWGDFDVRFREKRLQTDDFEELQLMSMCKHAIIVNSSYNWWGASLIQNQDKIICCPSKWWFDNKPIDILPDDWIRISDSL